MEKRNAEENNWKGNRVRKIKTKRKIIKSKSKKTLVMV